MNTGKGNPHSAYREGEEGHLDENRGKEEPLIAGGAGEAQHGWRLGAMESCGHTDRGGHVRRPFCAAHFTVCLLPRVPHVPAVLLLTCHSPY